MKTGFTRHLKYLQCHVSFCCCCYRHRRRHRRGIFGRGGGGLETPGPTIVADFHDVTVGGDPDIIQRRYLEAT